MNSVERLYGLEYEIDQYNVLPPLCEACWAPFRSSWLGGGLDEISFDFIGCSFMRELLVWDGETICAAAIHCSSFQESMIHGNSHQRCGNTRQSNGTLEWCSFIVLVCWNMSWGSTSSRILRSMTCKVWEAMKTMSLLGFFEEHLGLLARFCSACSEALRVVEAPLPDLDSIGF